MSRSYVTRKVLQCGTSWPPAAMALCRLAQTATVSAIRGSTLQLSRRHGHPNLDSHAASIEVTRRPAEEESDFVNIDALAAVGSSVSCAVMTGRQGSDAVVRATAGDTLGVVRAAEVADGVRYSRLGIPLPGPAPGVGGEAVARPNSRAVREENADETQIGTSSKADEGAVMAGDAMCASRDPATGDETSDEMLAARALPYDDERFAEMVLRMEVEGAIDETWQDARKACVEDVQELTSVLQSMRVRDVVCIDVTAKTSNFDFLLFGTCEGGRHIHLAAWAVQEADTLHRIAKVRRRQVDELWEVVPVGRIVVNLMVESLRDELTLERKWAVTANMDPLAVANAPISEGRQVRAHGLWSLTVNLQDLEDFEVDYCKDVLLRQR